VSETFDRRRLHSSIRIWRDNAPVGAGFVIGERHVMTCAHVVADSAGDRARLRGHAEPPLDLLIKMDAFSAPGRFFAGRVVADSWRPETGVDSSELDDVAVIEIVEGELPPSAVRVHKTGAVRDRDVIVGLGVAANLPQGVPIEGKFQQNIANRFLISGASVDAAVRPGCSGAAAWNLDRGGVAGMIAEMQQSAIGRVIPIDLLEQVWRFDPLPPPTRADLNLDGLQSIASAGPTRALARAYGADIRRTSECANVVGDLKRLHDLVDQLRRSVYAPLRSVVQRLPAPDAYRDLAQQRGVFLGLRGRIAATAGPPSFRAGEFPWVEEQLAYVADDLTQALEEQRHELALDAGENLRQVVEVELTSLDSRIAEATRQLDLEALIARLRALRQDVAESGAEPSRVEALDRDIETLAQIEVRVTGLIELHHEWQRVDSYLNAFETALNQSMETIGTSWRLLSRRLAKVCPADGPETVPGLAGAVAGLDDAVREKEATRLWIRFPELATRLRDRFFTIDRDLLEECERIRIVGKSLGEVVEKLDGGR
jgi:Trypsin-like peptidase domain